MARRMVPIMYKNHVGIPCVLRNYIASHEPPTNLTISEAMLATCATPPLFTSTSIEKDFATFEYTGGDLGLSNPTGEIITEAHRAFGSDVTVACLLSIACGHSGVNPSPSESGVTAWTEFLNHVTMDSEKTAHEMAARMENLTLYHRLSVEHGLTVDRLNAWGDLVVIATHTTTYLGDLEVIERVNSCADTINHADGFTTLEQLSR
jgi:predicted acylesterase/phospholipase RssA